MADGTKIEWTDATWNPVTGCTLVSEGCRNCYAARLAATRLKHHPSREGLARLNADGIAKFTGRVRFNEQWLTQPLAWRKPRRIFVCAHGDLFHEAVPDEWIDRVFAVMALAPQHIFQVLTKRPERMREYLSSDARPVLDEGSLARPSFRDETPGARTRIAWQLQKLVPVKEWTRGNVPWPLANVWLGVSVEDQAAADERIPLLLETPAAKRFISAEPLLGPIDLTALHPHDFAYDLDTLNPESNEDTFYETVSLDWVIVGGESGPHARPMHPDWARSLRDQCAAAGVPFFFKQWGEWCPGENVRDPMRRTQETAEWFGGRWIFGRVTPSESASGHIDDEPDLYRAGKKAGGTLLDGRAHLEVPA